MKSQKDYTQPVTWIPIITIGLCVFIGICYGLISLYNGSEDQTETLFPNVESKVMNDSAHQHHTEYRSETTSYRLEDDSLIKGCYVLYRLDKNYQHLRREGEQRLYVPGIGTLFIPETARVAQVYTSNGKLRKDNRGHVLIRLALQNSGIFYTAIFMETPTEKDKNSLNPAYTKSLLSWHYSRIDSIDNIQFRINTQLVRYTIDKENRYLSHAEQDTIRKLGSLFDILEREKSTHNQLIKELEK